jgi:hypothetical protein
MPIRKRPKAHKFQAIVSQMNDVCHHDHICNDCMESYAAEAESNRPGHVWSVIDGKVAYMEDMIAESMLGRPLLPNEGVVHKDSDPLNNRRENLAIVVIADPEKS